MTGAEYARHRAASGLAGGTRQAVSLAVKQGRIRKLPDGTIDPDEADAMWAANTVSNAATPQTAAARKATPAPAPATDYHEERAKHEAAKRERAELELAVRKGELLESGAVRAAIYEAFRNVRDRVRSVPARVGHEVSAETDAAKCVAIIAKELDLALGEVASLADSV